MISGQRRACTCAREKKRGRKKRDLWNRSIPAFSRLALHYSRANTPRKVVVLETRSGRYTRRIDRQTVKGDNKRRGAARREWTSALASFASRGKERRRKRGEEKRGEADKKKVPSMTVANNWHSQPRADYADRRQVTACSKTPESSSIYSTFYTRGTDREPARNHRSSRARWERPTVVRRSDEIYLTPSGVSDVRLSSFCKRSVLDMLTLFAVMLTFYIPDCRQEGEAGMRTREPPLTFHYN